MSITITSTISYAKTAIESYIDYTVFDSMYKNYERTKSSDPFDDIYNEPYLGALISSYTSLILYTAFSYESYTNLIGNDLLDGNFFEKYLDKLSVLDKLSAVIKLKYNMEIDLGSEPFQTIKEVLKYRNKIVHEKGKTVRTLQEYNQTMEKNKIFIDENKILTSMKLLHDFMKPLDSSQDFLTVFAYDTINSWLIDSNYYYRVSSDLLYKNALFPNIDEYQDMVRRHTGYFPLNVYQDTERKVIYKK